MLLWSPQITKENRHEFTQWHFKFAWKPVKTIKNEWVWLEHVLRKREQQWWEFKRFDW